MKRINKYIGAIALGATIMVVPSCTDTWDEHYGQESTTATETLWEQIIARPELSRFAAIAEKTNYYRDEKHPQKEYTYKDMLNSTQKLTLFAPTNDAFTDEEFNAYMQMAEERGYSVQQQLMANSIVLWSNIASGNGVDSLRMLNGKIIPFDKSKATIGGIDLKEKNIAASNGTLHTVGTRVPFAYNLYEYLKDEVNASSKNLTTFYNYIVANDTTYFNEGSSIEGPTDEYGNPTYVDSAYVTTNNMFFGTKRFPSNSDTDRYLTYVESFGANIASEDSSFVLLMPTDVAWSNAYNKLKGLYTYAKEYVDCNKSNGAENNIIIKLEEQDKHKESADKRPVEEIIDSVSNQNINMDIVSPLCFNVNMQPNAAGRRGVWKADDFIAERGNSAKFFVNTYNDTLRTDDNWNKTEVMNGTPVKLSNGYGIITDNWNLPHKFYKPDVNVDINNYAFYGKSEGSRLSYGFTKTNWSEQTGGGVYNYDYFYLRPSGDQGNPLFTFKLVGNHSEKNEAEIMSGKYQIKLVLVPNYYMTSSDTAIAYTISKQGKEGSGFVTKGDTIPVKHKIRCLLNYNNGELVKDGAKYRETQTQSAVIDYDGTKIDTLVVKFPNDMSEGPTGKTYVDYVTFPCSYKNLRYSYPTLTITTATTNAERLTGGYNNYICIDQIIVESLED